MYIYIYVARPRMSWLGNALRGQVVVWHCGCMQFNLIHAVRTSWHDRQTAIPTWCGIFLVAENAPRNIPGYSGIFPSQNVLI